MNELAADGIAVTVTCRVLGIARQPYYRWLKKRLFRNQSALIRFWS